MDQKRAAACFPVSTGPCTLALWGQAEATLPQMPAVCQPSREETSGSPDQEGVWGFPAYLPQSPAAHVIPRALGRPGGSGTTASPRH